MEIIQEVVLANERYLEAVERARKECNAASYEQRPLAAAILAAAEGFVLVGLTFALVWKGR